MSVESVDKPEVRVGDAPRESHREPVGEARMNRPTQRPGPGAAPKKQGGHWWVTLVVLAVLGAAGYGGYRWWQAAQAQARAQAAAAAQPRGAVPVTAAVVRRGDFPIYFKGLGTVTAENVITVRTRVDGRLMKYNFEEGTTVKENQVIAEIDPRPFVAQLVQAQGLKARDEALLLSAQQDLEKYTNAGTSVAKQLLDTAAATVKQYEGAVKNDQGQIDAAELQITYCKIVAPITGQIGLTIVDPGNEVHAADTTGLAVIAQVEPITVVFSLSEDTLPLVMKAMRGEEKLDVEAWSHDLTIKLATGKLMAIDSQIDPTTLMMKFKADFPNTDHSLVPNQAVNARLLVDTKKNVLLVSTSAVQRNAKGEPFAYVVGEDGAVEVRPIVLGDVGGLDPTEGEVTPVASGLEVGEQVVTDGVDKLQPGTKVTVRAVEGAGDSATQSATGPATGPATTRPRRGRR